MGEFAVGQPVPRFEDPRLLRGGGRYVDDMVLPRMAFGHVLRSPYAHARIRRIDVAHEPLPAVVSTAGASEPGAPRVWEDCPDNICFVHEVGDKAAVEAGFARADHVVKRRMVINRVTAAAMEPRGSIGDYNPSDGRYTIYTTLQRTHAYRAELAQIINVPESRVRVVGGDSGGSFGLKPGIS